MTEKRRHPFARGRRCSAVGCGGRGFRGADLGGGRAWFGKFLAWRGMTKVDADDRLLVRAGG
jgi:hypothetical protein